MKPPRCFTGESIPSIHFKGLTNTKVIQAQRYILLRLGTRSTCFLKALFNVVLFIFNWVVVPLLSCHPALCGALVERSRTLWSWSEEPEPTTQRKVWYHLHHHHHYHPSALDEPDHHSLILCTVYTCTHTHARTHKHTHTNGHTHTQIHTHRHTHTNTYLQNTALVDTHMKNYDMERKRDLISSSGKQRKEEKVHTHTNTDTHAQ